MRILNPEIEARIKALPDTDIRQKTLLKGLLEFEHEHSDKELYAYKQQILQMLDDVMKEFPDDSDK